MNKRTILWNHFVEHRISYLIGFALLSISSALQLFIPIILGSFTDRLQQSAMTYKDVVRDACLLIAAGFGIAFFRAFSRTYLFRLSRMLEMKVRNDLFTHWEKLSAQYFNNTRIGDLMTHAISDAGIMREVTMNGVFNIMEAFVLISISVVAMTTSVNPMLTLLTMLPLPFLSILAYRFNKRILKQSNDVQQSIDHMTSRVQEFTAGIRVVKAFVQ
ncbi:putative multidrug resistance ABC transporter ATP-binding/permease protein YheI [compost metagenome]